jgi:endonuclease YncB( thermonuclease family)
MRRLLSALAVAALMALAAAPAQAETTGPCGVGAQSPTCHFWTGKVTFIGDGDTVSVHLDGASKSSSIRVRVTGINALEEYVHTSTAADRVGECHANEATARLEQLVAASKGRVRLAAQDPTSHSGSRARRQVSVNIGGRWRDVGRTLLNEGHALWLSNGNEWAWNASYSVIAARAAGRHVGIWNPDYCGAGPAADLKLWVNADADGNDTKNVNGEWVRIKNLDQTNPVPLGGWTLRDSDLRHYVFKPDEVVPPNTTITVFVGRGTDAAPGQLYWNLRGPIFDNPSSIGKGYGDGAYLSDPDGDIRAFMQYPCRWHCSDPLKGEVRLTAAYKPKNEYVTLDNTSGHTIDLEGYGLWTPGHTYAFQPPSTLAPGQSMRVNLQGSPEADTPLDKNWGLTTQVLGNTSDVVKLRTFDYIDVACQAWGTSTCG